MGLYGRKLPGLADGWAAADDINIRSMTEEIPNATQAVRFAIEFLTPYVAADTQEKRAEVAEYIAQRLSGPDALDPIHVIRGQLCLNELLLLSLARDNGAQPDDYRAWAGEWLRTHSPQFPE